MSAESKTPYLDKLMALGGKKWAIYPDDTTVTVAATESKLASLVDAEVDAAIGRCAAFVESEQRDRPDDGLNGFALANKLRALASTTNKEGS